MPDSFFARRIQTAPAVAGNKKAEVAWMPIRFTAIRSATPIAVAIQRKCY
jgi:hypothetical protein